MNKLIVFDFNRTLFDPDSRGLVVGARDLLEAARTRGFRLVLLAQAAPSRRELIEELGIGSLFEEIILVEHKSQRMLEDLAQRCGAEAANCYVVGDRARGEVLLGHALGWHTIWLRAGRFADETPEGYKPEFTVNDLAEVSDYLT